MQSRADQDLRVALVTGACSGIGRALAMKLASLGYGVVLVSQRGEALRAVQQEIHNSFARPTWVVKLDLAQPSAAVNLYQEVQRQGIEVDILVNNAGVFFFGEVATTDVDRAEKMLSLHVVTPSILCTLFCRDMQKRRRGHVLIVSSISAYRDFPGIAYYGSSKKYLRGFATALRSELLVYGINVTCLLPGATATALYDPKQVPVQMAKDLGVMMSAEEVAEAGLAAMFARQAEVIPGRLTRVLVTLAKHVPQAGIDLLRRHAPWLR